MCIPLWQRDHAAITAALASIEKELAIADKVLATYAYLTRLDFSLADIQLGLCLYRCYDIDVVRADLPHLQTYHSRLETRLGFFHHVMASCNKVRVITG